MSACWTKTKGALGKCLFLLLSYLPVANAQSIEELALFEFGVLAIPGNSVVSEVELPRSGRNITVTGSIVLVRQGLPGRYLVTGLPPSTPVDISLNDTELVYAGAGGSERLRIGDYDVESVVSNSQGEVELLVGGTLRTSGQNVPYEDGPYTGSTRLFLTYWDKTVGEYLTKGFEVDLEAEVRTSFNMEEAQAMSFGKLFARATPDDQSEFTLAPDGKFSIKSPGNSRIVSLSGPQPAVIQVSGAAANRSLTIDLPEADVYLRHTEEPTAPYFIVSRFTSEPSGSGRTDENGILDIAIGSTLSTKLTSEVTVYPAGTYEATYNVTVSY